MWSTFALCALLCVIVLYLPGALLCRSLGLKGAFSVACAPTATIALVSLLCIAYGMLSIPCTAASVLGPVALIVLAGYGLTRLAERRGRAIPCLLSGISESDREKKFDYGSLALYVVVGIGVCAYVYVKSLDGSESFYARHDNITHLNLVRSYLDSGIWSTLQTSNYLASPECAISRSGGSFYPAAWHGVAALLCSLSQCSVPLGINALNAVVAGVVFPTSMWVLMRALFPENRGIVLWGALATMAFTAFPWAFFTKGPLYSNLLAFALLPAPLGLVVGGARTFAQARACALPLVALGLLSFISLALSQPNALFTAFVFLAAFGGKTLWDARRPLGPKRATAAFALYICGIAALWIILFNLPFLQAVIWYEWPKSLRMTEALFKLCTLSFTASVPQVLLVIAVLAGLLACVVKRRCWLLAPVAFFGGTYLICTTTNGFLKHFLSGFWYTDPVRMAACTVLFLIPIASLGLWAIARAIGNLACQTLAAEHRDERRCAIAATCVLGLAFCLCNFFPNYHFPGEVKGQVSRTPFGVVKQRLGNFYDTEGEKVYDSDEQAFVEEVLASIPEGSLVLNQPNDGSVFAYGLDNLNTYYRQISHEGETDNARIIREHLNDIASDPAVQQAVHETGAQYVLLLDQGVNRKKGTWLAQYKDPESWQGVDSITDDTPGFKKILADGEMRLYQIE